MVVFTDEKSGKFPNGSEIEGAVEGAFIGGPIPKEGYRHPITLRQLGSERSASSNRHASTHDPVGTEHADAEIGNMHGAALAVAITVTAPKQLGHHEFQVGALGDGMSVPTVRADDLVVPAQGSTDTHRDGFLAQVGMHD